MCSILATPAITLLAALVEVLDLPSRGGSMMGKLGPPSSKASALSVELLHPMQVKSMNP